MVGILNAARVDIVKGVEEKLRTVCVGEMGFERRVARGRESKRLQEPDIVNLNGKSRTPGQPLNKTIGEDIPPSDLPLRVPHVHLCT